VKQTLAPKKKCPSQGVRRLPGGGRGAAPPSRPGLLPAPHVLRVYRPSASLEHNAHPHLRQPHLSTSRSPAPPMHILLRRRTSPSHRRRIYCERAARTSASNARRTSASRVKVAAAVACKRSAPSCSGAARPHPGGGMEVSDVYARVCSCRQCWASKCRGL
jgi:hypothetical protein